MRSSPAAALGQLVALATLVAAAAACGSGRNYDNPPEISPEPLGTVTTTTTTPPTTAFIPSTAPTTLAPPTQPPPPEPEPEVQQPLPTSATTTPATIPERYSVVAGDTLSGIASC